MPTCVQGHASAADDYCDVCGSPIGTPAAEPTPSPPAEVKACPACEAPVSGRFCEACGHDSALPEPVPPPQPASAAASVVWTAVVAADREFYERVLAREGPDTVEFPPSVGYGRVYVAQQKGLFFALNADTGRVSWRKSFGRCAAASPTIGKGLVYQAYMHPVVCAQGQAGALPHLT